MDMMTENVTFNETFPHLKALIYEDAMVDSWMLMSSPVSIVGLVAAYLGFVLYLGPKMMETRKPYDLKIAMMPYNLIQVVWNFYLVAMLFTTDGALSYLLKHYCQPLDMRLNPLRLVLCNAMWHYTVLKIMDLADTVFFVLRKKQDHVTFLHVYHHSAMALFSWATLKYLRGEQAVLLGFMNALVHVVMYTYYFLAALGERVRRYLWWKRYLTTMQIGQFIIGVLYLSTLILMRCDLPRLFTYIWASQILVFLALFINFYIKTYTSRPRTTVKNKKQ
ncbi:elongation of very long chain fatty acids protein 7-like [Macrosteles quadrilineatus]|uniref:elongation of very long chain fatty acids protein 7-like n=1 Tax=Macrosteles quadrilineatus TaxID=74068 RepID=UPI0023E0C4C9|nr:elongation of very long chain fatty acids protein 7-like [Macrosteles quadrilineatus]